MTRSERTLLLAVAGISLALRFVALFRYRFDSDEQQHLHVAWGWTAGLIQYRDLFDNHAPLFHMLTAPLVAILGERADILLWMRVPMLFVLAAVLYATWLVARTLFDARTGLWAMALLSVFPPFFLKSLEYRIDNLWIGFWMAALVALLHRRGVVAGLLLGAALATSVKTAPLLLAIVAAAAATELMVNGQRRFARALPGIAAVGIVPLALVIVFAALGALQPLIECTITFNSAFALSRDQLWLRRLAFPPLFLVSLAAAWRMRHGVSPQRFFVTLTAVLFVITVTTLWPLVSPRDFLPVMPLAAIFGAAELLKARNPVRALAIVCTLSLLALVHYANRFTNGTAWHITMMDQALRLSRPGESLIDYKGETIYRRRPFYYALETVTRGQLARGVILDTIADDVVRTRTYVAQADGPMWPPQAKAFLNENFLNMGRLRAAGQWIGDDGTFTIAIPGEYTVVSERGIAPGLLDGVPLTGSRPLAAGSHKFESTAPGQRLAVLWAPAFQRGHSPFHLRDTKF